MEQTPLQVQGQTLQNRPGGNVWSVISQAPKPTIPLKSKICLNTSPLPLPLLSSPLHQVRLEEPLWGHNLPKKGCHSTGKEHRNNPCPSPIRAIPTNISWVGEQSHSAQAATVTRCWGWWQHLYKLEAILTSDSKNTHTQKKFKQLLMKNKLFAGIFYSYTIPPNPFQLRNPHEGCPQMFFAPKASNTF